MRSAHDRTVPLSVTRPSCASTWMRDASSSALRCSAALILRPTSTGDTPDGFTTEWLMIPFTPVR